MAAPLPTVAIAGVSGFVGKALSQVLAKDHRVIGLGRGERSSNASLSEFRSCDLFSLKDAEAGLAGVDFAVYLVHSMMPSATLTQGSFEDFDLVAADNFARAAAKHGVKQIVYLGGLIPRSAVNGDASLSKHLASRLEVERALAASGTQVTALRAGMVIGKGGSSFLMLHRLVERLPIMLTPRWTATRTQPIDLDDVVTLLAYCVGREDVYGQVFDVGGPDVLTYREMIARLGARLGKHPRLISVPFFTPGLSRLWVSLVTGAPKSLVQPLVQSLAHEMIADDRRLQERAHLPGRSFDESVERLLGAGAQAKSEPDRREPVAYRGAARHRDRSRDVRSVQRMPLPEGKTAEWVAEEYMRWLPSILPLLLRVRVAEDRVCRFTLLGVTLLVLAYASERSGPDRALFYIRGGVLANTSSERGRFEFRAVPGTQIVIAAIHDFVPRLPWPIYAYTQAKFHLWVMKAFARHLARYEARRSERSPELGIGAADEMM